MPGVGSCLTDRAYAAGNQPAGASAVDERPRPPRREHSGSLKAIQARQLQVHVRGVLMMDPQVIAADPRDERRDNPVLHSGASICVFR